VLFDRTFPVAPLVSERERVRNLDILRRRVSVEETIGEARGALVVGPPKSSAARRTMSMPDGLVTMIAEHLGERGLTAGDGDAYVFAAPEGGPLRYSTFRSRVWAPSCERAGLKGLGFHDLRRASATAMVAAGVDVRTAQNRLGHSDPRMTISLYAQATTEADASAAKGLGDHFLHRDDDLEVVPRGSRGVGGS
jgi:integrase